jgi:hypothetical protein
MPCDDVLIGSGHVRSAGKVAAEHSLVTAALQRSRLFKCLLSKFKLLGSLPSDLMLRSFARFPARACSIATSASRLRCSAVTPSPSQPHRAAFASQPPQQPRSRPPPSPQQQQAQQQPRGPGQIVPPPGAAAPPPLPPVVEVTPESAEAIFSSSRSNSIATPARR